MTILLVIPGQPPQKATIGCTLTVMQRNDERFLTIASCTANPKTFPVQQSARMLFFFLAYLFCFLLQRQTNQSICLVCHKQRNVQHIVVQLQIVQ